MEITTTQRDKMVEILKGLRENVQSGYLELGDVIWEIHGGEEPWEVAMHHGKEMPVELRDRVINIISHVTVSYK